MNGRQIEIFHALMRMGTVTQAAQRLGITQPAVTTSIKQIEKQLGFNLFHRAAGRLHPTAEAHILFTEAERLQNGITVFKQLAERLRDDLTSHLNIAALPAFSNALIPEVTAQFTARVKECLLDISTQHHKQILKDISHTSGHFNLGFTFGMDDRSGIGTTPVGKARIVALIPSSWPIAGKTEISIEALAGLPVIGTFPGEPLGDAVEKLMYDAGINTNYSVRVHNHYMAASLVSKGVGATVIDSVTASFTKSQPAPESFQIIPIKNAPDLPVMAIYSYEHPLNNHAKLFIKLFRQAYTQLLKRSLKTP